MAARDTMMSKDRSQVFSSANNVFFRQLLDGSSDGWCVRDLNKNIIYVNAAFSSLLGSNISSLLCGVKLEELTTPFDQYKTQLINLEKRAVNNQSSISKIIPIVSHRNFKRELTNISLQPYMNSEKVCIGTCWVVQKYQPLFFHSQDVQPVFLTDNERLYSSPYQLLTSREWDVAWPLIMGWKSTEIWKSLKISNSHFRKIQKDIYAKLNVNTFEGLYAKVIALGWMNVIPQNIPYIL